MRSETLRPHRSRVGKWAFRDLNPASYPSCLAGPSGFAHDGWRFARPQALGADSVVARTVGGVRSNVGAFPHASGYRPLTAWPR